MRIPPILSFYGLTTPKSLFHKTKRNFITAYAIDEFCKTFPDAQRRLGALPFDWIKGFDKKDIPLVTARIDEVFQEFSKGVAEIEQGWCGDYCSISKFDPHIEKLTAQMREILKRDDISIKYASCGRVKHCHKIQVGENSYALSSFISPKILDKDFAEYIDNNGRGFEAQNIFTLFKRGSHGRTARPFMSRISSKTDESGGYILSKFIDKTHGSKIEIGDWQKLRQFFINHDNHFGNSINGIDIEVGYYEMNPKYVFVPQVRADWLNFARVIDSFPQNMKFMKKNQLAVISELSKARSKGVDICDKEFLKPYYWASDEQFRFAKKLVKRVKTLRKLRRRMEDRGDFKYIQKMLQDDFYDLNRQEKFQNIFAYREFLLAELGIQKIY